MKTLNLTSIALLALLMIASTTALAERRHNTNKHQSDRHSSYQHNNRHNDHKAILRGSRSHHKHDQRQHANKDRNNNYANKHHNGHYKHGYSSHHYQHKYNGHHYYQPWRSNYYRPARVVHHALKNHYYPRHGLNVYLKF